MVAIVVLAAGLVTVAVRRSSGSTSASGSEPAPRAPLPTAKGTSSTTTTSTTAAAAKAGEPAYITTIKQQVAELRGLAWKAPLTVDVVSRDEVARRAQAANERDRRPDRMAGDADTFRVLHLIPADLDYTKTVDDLLSGLVLGFYDPRTKELVVGQSPTDDKGNVDGATRVVLAHELDHALTDQWFDFGSATQALDDADRQEEVDAFDALIEGDARSFEPRFAQKYLSEDEQLDYGLGGLGSTDTGAAAKVLAAPTFLVHYLYYPYEAGAVFAKAQRGTAADENAGVDAAYRRPPVSTEQIFHPELYAADQRPHPPDLADVAGATGCERRRRNTLGELKMREVLDTYLDAPQADRAAAGWDGDVFETVRCGHSLGLVERWRADTDADAARLLGSLAEWAPDWAKSEAFVDGRFSGRAGSGRVVRTGTVVTLVLAADAPTADRLASSVGI